MQLFFVLKKNILMASLGFEPGTSGQHNSLLPLSYQNLNKIVVFDIRVYALLLFAPLFSTDNGLPSGLKDQSAVVFGSELLGNYYQCFQGCKLFAQTSNSIKSLKFANFLSANFANFSRYVFFDFSDLFLLFLPQFLEK